MTVALIGIALFLLVLLLVFEKRENTAGKLFTKTPLSVLFVAAAWLQPDPGQAYAQWMLMGFVLCLIGDICLVYSSRNKLFLSGLAAFLCGHVFYVIAFYSITDISVWTWGALGVLVVVSVVVFSWLRPFLGNMVGPVIAYILVISLMVSGAASLFGDPSANAVGRWLVFIGAISFFLSDLFVARQQFVRDAYVNRSVGLPLYYLGQFMLAFSIAYI
ncbi:MAG: lysoplasmalogenase [Desulfobacteraceae bacterium]|nr:lysoplasmalogenase [Desulfobacteraceae bacterium]